MSSKGNGRQDDDDEDFTADSPVHIITEVTSSRKITITIDGYFDKNSHFRDAITAMELAGEDDTIVLRMFSGGGSLNLALRMRTAFATTKASTMLVIDPYAASAATAFINVADSVVVMPHAYIMVHGASYGLDGHMASIKNAVEFSEKRIRAVLEDIYEGFLTPEEISALADQSKDFYMDEHEIAERLERMSAYQEAKNKEQE